MRRTVEKQIEAVTAQTHHTLLGMMRIKNKDLEALCRQLVGACEKTTWLLHRRALDPQEVTILVEMESALEAARKAGITP